MTITDADKLIKKYMAKFTLLLGIEGVVTRRKNIRGTQAGNAITNKYRRVGSVAFNVELLAHHNDEAELRNTVAHELCHVAAELQSIEPVQHGYPWKRLMRSLNENPTRTHTMDVPMAMRRAITKYLYKCPKCQTDFWLSGQRHKRKQTGRTSYVCSFCSEGIIFTGRSEKRKKGQKD
ncbi:MAG: SprT-like domain-containing protein [Candidatus Bathyarchaeia archaeon]